MDGEGRAPLRGLQDDGHAAVRRELDVQAEDEVFGVAQRQGHTFRGICGDGVLRRRGATDERLDCENNQVSEESLSDSGAGLMCRTW